MNQRQWVNTGPDHGALPALLDRVAQRVPVSSMDEIWVFPYRRVADGDSVVCVITTFDDDADRRRVCTFRFTIARNNRGIATVQEDAGEHAVAPANAISRVIEGVLRRLGDDAAVPPHGRQIGGDAERWLRWLLELGAGGDDAGRQPAAPDAATAALAPPPGAGAAGHDAVGHNAG
jgi:hypothetical protein